MKPCTFRIRHNAATIATVVLFSFLHHSVTARHWSVHLRSHSGNFLTALGGGGGAMVADRTVAGEWETFTLVDVDAGELEDNDEVALRTTNGHFVSARSSLGGILQADAERPEAGERFLVHKLNPSNESKIQTGDQIDLMTLTGLFVSAVNGGGGALRADQVSSTDDAHFTLDLLGAPSPLMLSGPFSQTQLILATPTGQDHDGSKGLTVGNCKNPFLGDGPPHCYDMHNGTDFLLAGWFPAMDAGSIEVVAAAPGFVVQIAEGNTDHCHIKFPPPSPDAAPEDWITCPGTEDHKANFVAVMQDDGLIAYYYHLKRSSVAVMIRDRVVCGQTLGRIGSSGVSTVPHLHFALERIPLSDPFPPRGSASYNNIKFSSLVDPYTPDILWTHLSGQVPVNVCMADNGVALPVPGEVGATCAMPNQPCAFPAVCDNGTCRVLGVAPQFPCDENHVCGRGLECSNGTCQAKATENDGGHSDPCLTPCVNGNCPPRFHCDNGCCSHN